jgi:stage III sporulation protein AH
MQIVNNDTLEDSVRQQAVDELVGMTADMEKESACEQQLLARGFGECVVLVSEGCVDVTVNKAELTEVERAQIEDIVTRKAECDVSEVVITVVAN